MDEPGAIGEGSVPQWPAAAPEPRTPWWVWAVVTAGASLAVAALLVLEASRVHWTDEGLGGESCGSALWPNVVSTGSQDECMSTLRDPRTVGLGLCAGAALLALVGFRWSGSVRGRRTRGGDACLILLGIPAVLALLVLVRLAIPFTYEAS